MSDINDRIDIGTAFDLIDRGRRGKPPPMATCPRDGEPLVPTFEFRGAEFICMVCGRKYGFLAPKPAESTAELEARLVVLREQYEQERTERMNKEGA